MDMSQIPAEGLNHYTVVYGLNSIKLKYKVVGHQTAWKTMEDCFSDICAFGAGFERPKDYSRADFHNTEASVINKIKNQDCASNAVDHSSREDVSKIKITSTTGPKTRKLTIHKFWQNYHNSSQFPTGTISLHVSKQVKPGDDISSPVNMIKHFLGKIVKSILYKRSQKLHPILPGHKRL